ncbi:paraoxonase 2 [Neolentinus lepideus HHB14362 ss-1]|uniref:Paraoxonase 2 n=1 Tax=Neolentinus lepideus HHB14362 ss-1 TaxID=1314782 RepID=A0A165SEQ4_9AGAM|nr:paraoxonase 2 [Neolentinus lepideus HHB14362 ss-1]
MPSIFSLAVPILVAALVIFYEPLPFYRAIGKAQIESALITRWENSSTLNNERCVVHQEADACEDVKIHFQSSTAFISCGDPEQRMQWYPCSGRHNARGRREDSFREHLFKYDIKRKETTKLRVIGLDGDFITHGIDVYSFPDEPSKIHIFAVNHARDGDTIAIFSHVLGSDSVELVKNVRHPGIYNANGVAASGPLDFYITNDHYYTSKGGLLRKLEETYGPWTWATHVQYCDANGPITACRRVSDTFPGANGIVISGDELYVGDARSGVARIFEIQPDRSLINTATIHLGGAADNINPIPTTGDLVISVFPGIERSQEYQAHFRELGKSFKVPSAAVRLDRSEGFKPELIYYDDGSVISYMTVAAIDPYNNVLINGGVIQYGGFAVCDLKKGVV